MNEIKCPECGKVFSVDEASYASIVNQVRTKELEDEIRRRTTEIEKQQQLKQQSDKLIAEKAFQQKLNAKEQELEKRKTACREGHYDCAFGGANKKHCK